MLNVHSDVELLCVKIYFVPKPLYIYIVYLPPSLNFNVHDSLFDYFETLNYATDNTFLILGDFNIVNNANILNRVQNFCELANCEQYNNVPNSNQRYLDYVLSNQPCNVVKDNPFVNEDPYHPSLNVQLEIIYKFSNCKFNTKSYFNFKRADFLRMYNLLSNVDWGILNSYADVNQAVDKFYNDS